jgi:xylan 1,4-beta-xylosidase
MIAAVPELKDKPIVIGESDPDGCAACQGPQLGYRNTALYASYEAAVLARHYVLADRRGVNLQGACTWAFEFEDQPYFSGQRTLANNGLDLPVMNVFRMLAQMGGQRVATHSSGEQPLDAIMRSGVRGAPDVGAMASLAPGKLCVLIWHYHDDDVPGPDAAVTLSLDHLPAAAKAARLTHYRIDAAHSNAFALWKQLGSPTAPTEAQYTQLERAGQLTALAPVPGRNALEFTLPRQGVSLVVLDWTGAAP